MNSINNKNISKIEIKSENILLKQFIEKIIINLKENKANEAEACFECLIKLQINNKNLAKDGEAIKTEVEKSIIAFLEKNIINLYPETIRIFCSFLIKNGKQLESSILEIVEFLMNNGCKTVKEESLSLALEYSNLMLNKFEPQLSPLGKALYTVNSAGCLHDLHNFRESQDLYEKFFDLYNHNHLEINIPIIPKHIIRNFTNCITYSDSFSKLETKIKNLKNKKLLNVNEVKEIINLKIKKEFENKKYSNCLKLYNILTKLNINDHSLYLFSLNAYLKLNQNHELIAFAENLLSLPSFKKDKDAQFNIVFPLGLAYSNLLEIPKACKSFLDAFKISPNFQSAYHVYLCCLEDSVNRPSIIKNHLIPRLTKDNNKLKNQDLINLLRIAHGLYSEKGGSNTITELEEMIASDKLNSEVLPLAFDIFSRACKAYGHYQKLIEFFIKFKKRIDPESFYREVLPAFVITKNFKAAAELISDIEKENSDVKNSLFRDARNVIASTFIEAQEYEKAYSFLEEHLITNPKITIQDTQQLLYFSDYLDINPLLLDLETKFIHNPHITLIRAAINFSHDEIQKNITTIQSLFNDNKLPAYALELYLIYILSKKDATSEKNTVENLITLIEHCETKNLVNARVYFIKGILLCCNLKDLEAAKKAFGIALAMNPQCFSYFNDLFKNRKEPKDEYKSDIKQITLSINPNEEEVLIKIDTNIIDDLPSNNTTEVEIETNINITDDLSELDQLAFNPTEFHKFMVALKNEKAKVISSTSIQVSNYEWNLGDEKILNSASEKVHPVCSNNSELPICFITIDSTLADELDKATLSYFTTAMNKCRVVRRENGQPGLKILNGVVAELVHPGIDERLCATAANVVYGLNPNQPPLIILSKKKHHTSVPNLVRKSVGKFLFK